MTNPAAVASQINYLESLIAGYASTLRDPTSSPQQKSQAQREIPQLELTIESLRTQLTQLSLTVAKDAGVVPPPPKTAGQTVNDDAVPNPIKTAPLEADPGRRSAGSREGNLLSTCDGPGAQIASQSRHLQSREGDDQVLGHFAVEPQRQGDSEHRRRSFHDAARVSCHGQ